MADVPLDPTTALLMSPLAPLAALGPSDFKAVWACVPSGFAQNAPELLIYFHGHKYFVTAEVGASGVTGRAPNWLPNLSPRTVKDNAGNTKSLLGNPFAIAKAKGQSQGPAGHFYHFDQLTAGAHLPLVLLPEDGTFAMDFDLTIVPKPTKANPAATGPAQEYWSKEHVEGLSDPACLGKLIDDCLARLKKLAPPGGGIGTYLSTDITASSLKRLFLTGHSGGGVPLFGGPAGPAASASTLALTVPTTIVSFDATYNDYSANVRSFCEAWDNKGHLGNGAQDSRVVIVVGPGGTAGNADLIFNNLTKPKSGKAFAVTKLTFTKTGATAPIDAALKSSPIVMIYATDGTIAHDNVPQTFTPMILRNP